MEQVVVLKSLIKLEIMTTDHKVYIGIGLLTLVILVGGVLLASNSLNADKVKISKPMMGEKMPDLGGKHVNSKVSDSEYNSNPPTSGSHWVGVAGPGIKDSSVADELVLHSMEHGAVVVWYREGLDQNEVDRIKKAFQGSSGKKIMLARKNLDVPVALTSWSYLLKLETVDELKIKEFIETNNDRAPEKAPI